MMPVIRIPDALYERLQKHAVPFVDTPATVIERWGVAYEKQQAGVVSEHIPAVSPVPPETGAAEKLGVSCRQTAGHENRPTVRATLGYLKNGQRCSVAAAVRWMGMDKWTFQEVRSVLDVLGLGGPSGVKDATIRAQLQSGQHHPEGHHGTAGDLDAASIQLLRELKTTLSIG